MGFSAHLAQRLGDAELNFAAGRFGLALKAAEDVLRDLLTLSFANSRQLDPGLVSSWMLDLSRIYTPHSIDVLRIVCASERLRLHFRLRFS